MRDWMSARLRGYADSVFDETIALAESCGAVNLSSGTPDTSTPAAIQAAAREAMAAGHNQYSLVRGEPVLRAAVAAHAARFYGQSIDPASEVSIVSGVTEGIFASAAAFLNPGDDAIVFQPYYDCYVPAIELAGARAVPVTLHAPLFRFDPSELRAAFSSRTRAILVNTPHNPTGTVFSAGELSLIAELCQQHDVLAITDEVYEHIVFDDARHIRLATLPGMWERTLTLGGAGKTFTCTGWRIGWAIGPPALHEALARLRQFTVFAAPTPLQIAIAQGLAFPDSYFRDLSAGYQARRDFLLESLLAFGLQPSKPEGSFFTLVDVGGYAADGWEFCRLLARDWGVAPLPMNTFYSDRRLGDKLARFAFCLGRETLEEAARRLSRPRGMKC